MRVRPPPRPPGTVGTLSRLYCLKCDEITLHQHNRCVHCDAQKTPNTVRVVRRSWNDS